MKAEHRRYKVTYFDGSKEEIIGTHNLPPQTQVRSIRLIKETKPHQNGKSNSAKLSERKYIVKHHDGTEELITGFHNLPDKTSVAAIHRVRDEQPQALQAESEYLCFADFEYTCGGMAEDRDFDVAYGQEILSAGLLVVKRETGEPMDTFYHTIRPAHNQILTGFCKNLTGLTQEEIDASDNFETVMKQAAAFCKQYDFAQIYVFGDTDRQMLLKDQKRHQPVPGLTNFIAMLQAVDGYLSGLLFQSALPIGLEKLKHICELDEPVIHHALADARDLCSVYFRVSGGQYNQTLARQYQSERINKAEYYRNRQFLSVRAPGRHGFEDAELAAQKENAITSALDVIAYLKSLNRSQPFVADMKLTAFCDDLLALLGAPEEHFAVQKTRKE
ncbi:MAG: exonuclease domain-containing protein [Peptococcaceae bacterium]|nr:exonuclease domain-containing protein [Peptococcaceae bacterium]